ncbi:MAG: hypothetical protein K2N56_11810 [Oscillospiraceae bacterium]|nr:hypothetical protein [Oscillospiraceae bacterium]
MSGANKNHGKIVSRAAGIYREIEEMVVCMIGAAILLCILPLFKITR